MKDWKDEKVKQFATLMNEDIKPSLGSNVDNFKSVLMDTLDNIRSGLKDVSLEVIPIIYT